MHFPPIVDNSRSPPRKKLGQHASQRLRNQVLRRDGPNCHWCGCMTYKNTDGTLRPANNATTFDHLVDREDGGADSAENGVIACWRCNTSRGAKSTFRRRHAMMHAAAPNRIFGTIIVGGCAI